MSVVLTCPNGCRSGRFEALNTPLSVDVRGNYLSHDHETATYICGDCQAVAIDVAAAAAQMAVDGEAALPVLVCPVCETRMLMPEDQFAVLLECPACETRFGIEEGLPKLHGGESG